MQQPSLHMPPRAGEEWTREENELTVSSYLEMLALELRGNPYVKAEYWRALQALLPARSKGAVEFKYGNVSAVLRDLRFPSIEGYKPYPNYQADLYEVVQQQLAGRTDLTRLVESQVAQPAAAPTFDNILAALVDRPAPLEKSARREPLAWREKPRLISPHDYLEIEARNTSLGAAGEQFVLDYERARLSAAGKERLAANVEHVSITRGPAAGFDILSFDADGREKLVEVKTTRYGRYTPFFVTRNEVATSDSYVDLYALYRVFTFEREPRLFILPGPVRASCSLDPALYEASVT